MKGPVEFWVGCPGCKWHRGNRATSLASQGHYSGDLVCGFAESDDGIGGVCKDLGCQVQNWKSDPEVNVSELGLISGNDGAVDG